jgi:arsenical pump membrane protein
LHVHLVLVLLISAASIAGMLVRPRGIPEAYWACAGAILLIAARLISIPRAGDAARRGLDVYLFLAGMMMLAEVAREGGVFDWLADIARRHANGSPARLFLLIYTTGVVVTALLSNDATAVVLTPAVLAVVQRAKVKATPYVLACALIANAASFILPISNPANLVIFASDMPALPEWLRTFALPSLAAVAITFFVLRRISRRDLEGELEPLRSATVLTAQGRLALVGLTVSCVALLLASGFGLHLGVVTCFAGIATMLLGTVRDRRVPVKVAAGVSWSIIPLVAALFVIMATLENVGLLGVGERVLSRLAQMPEMLGNLAAGFGVGLISNGMNNLPIGLISGSAVRAAHSPGHLASAVLIGVDLGPNLSVTGSLATILWLVALRREKVSITAWEFLKVGMIAMPAAMIGSLLALAL